MVDFWNARSQIAIVALESSAIFWMVAEAAAWTVVARENLYKTQDLQIIGATWVWDSWCCIYHSTHGRDQMAPAAEFFTPVGFFIQHNENSI